MPRNPGKKNQHNHRHENGLVGPGKRITKQKSNGHINGSARGAVSDEPVPTSPPCNAPANGQFTDDAYASSSDPKKEHMQEPRSALKQRDSEASIDGQDNTSANGNGSLYQNGHLDGKPRRSEPPTPKIRSAYEVSPVHLASTILRSCPGHDTVALLIFLLALPSLILTIIQALFASLTFMPPSGFTPGTLWSFLDVFQSPVGAPSLGTMAIVDIICFGLWFCLWNWARNFALDLAQVQIAITLGGAQTGKAGGVNGTCVVIVLLLHLVRSRGVRQFFFGNVVSAKLATNPRVAQFLQYLPNDSDFGDSIDIPSRIRSIVAVHIIAQALISYVRRRVANSQTTSTSKSTKRTDPEALAGGQGGQDGLSEPTLTVASVSGVDYQTPTTPGVKDSKDKGMSAKKRRRQANQVRSRQPFWAALASTKVHVMREYEHTTGTYKTSSNRDNGLLDSTTGDEVVWITYIDSSAIHFETANIGLSWQEQEASDSNHCRPFFVRINGAKWHSVSLEPTTDADESSIISAQWKGEVSGLAPDCTYTCSFARHDDDTDFASILVKTPAISDKDLPKALAPAPLRHSTHPSSPITTIRNSIQSSEAKLNDARNRMTKMRRSHKAGLTKLEKEVESLNTRLKSSSDDKKQQQKLLQAERGIRQMEEATSAIVLQLDELAVIPEDDTVEYNRRKKDFQERNDLLSAANETLESARSVAKSEISSVNSELSTVSARKERLVSRQSKLTEQHDRITQANAQGLNEKERKAAESAAKLAEQQRLERQYRDQFHFLQNEMQSLQMRTQQAWQEVSAYEKLAQSQRELMMKNAGPLTPEGNLPGTNPQFPTNRSFGFGMPSSSIHTATTMPYDPQNSPFLPYAKNLPEGTRPRSDTNRSAGATSNFSAEFDDADPIPPMPSQYDFDANVLDDRKGSGSSRGQNNGSPGVIVGTTGLGSPIRGRNSPGQPHSIW